MSYGQRQVGMSEIDRSRDGDVTLWENDNSETVLNEVNEEIMDVIAEEKLG